MSKSEKKTWQKPELVVLVRSNPEETVLTACKVTTNPPTSGPSRGSYQCTTQLACFATGTS
ncbi:MAG: hypothetical protein WA418_08075 [Bradyrhizobium sp.]